MTDLFEKQESFAPLAEQLRPQKLEDIIGQAHLLGTGKPLSIAFKSGKPHSMILWAPLVPAKPHWHDSWRGHLMLSS